MRLLNAFASWFAPPPAPSVEVRAGLARVTELVGGAQAAERDFERRLAGPVAHAQAHCAELIGALPAAVDVGRHAFSADPLVHALFASADDIADTIGRSAALRDYLGEPVSWQGEHFHALLAARRERKRVLGVASQGSVIATDVPQCLLYFSEHTLVRPAPDDATARAGLRAAAFDSLLRTFAEHVAAVREERNQLKVERELEKVRMQSRRGRADAEHLTRRIAELDERLHHQAGALLPGQLLQTLADFLMQPELALRIDPVEVQVDRRGAMAGDGMTAGSDAVDVRFMEVSGRDRRHLVVLPVRIRCDEAREALARARELRDRLLVL
ncbi:hypothetical protein [Pseudothauera rhizosphaerae]|uniref:Uncharacterized protein n=1 Tax=Pseudothauera rhizosphaerae TaxID=2565932 RepID=A0A4S4AW68_9RHOO|nr:hypothetical protein [Pseudothauera rhizosphaerae]THF64117.1 hypothetical protein E6O51_01985 [Pseudothauera rhizosphaerae]